MIVADELEADWAKVRIVQAPGDEKRYGNQDTDGSRSVRHFFSRCAECGAAARQMLEQAAAKQWGVPVGRVQAQNHEVVHAADAGARSATASSRRRGRAAGAGRRALKLKDPAAFRYIGKGDVGARRPGRHHDRQGDLRHRRARCRA